MKNQKLLIGGGVAVMLLTVAFFTVLKKTWWKEMIIAKWPVRYAELDESPGEWTPMAGWKPMAEYSLTQLVNWYYHGRPGWFQSWEGEDFKAWQAAQDTAGHTETLE